MCSSSTTSCTMLQGATDNGMAAGSCCWPTGASHLRTPVVELVHQIRVGHGRGTAAVKLVDRVDPQLGRLRMAPGERHHPRALACNIVIAYHRCFCVRMMHVCPQTHPRRCCGG
jgi:hypothetical protein